MTDYIQSAETTLSNTPPQSQLTSSVLTLFWYILSLDWFELQPHNMNAAVRLWLVLSDHYISQVHVEHEMIFVMGLEAVMGGSSGSPSDSSTAPSFG